MPAPRKTQRMQDQHDETERLYAEFARDGRIDRHEHSALMARFAAMRGELSTLDGDLAVCEAILRVGLTPKVERKLRELRRDRDTIVAFRPREPRDAA